MHATSMQLNEDKFKHFSASVGCHSSCNWLLVHDTFLQTGALRQSSHRHYHTP